MFSLANINTYSTFNNKSSISSVNVPSLSQTLGPLVRVERRYWLNCLEKLPDKNLSCSRHDIIRESGRISYLKSQSKRQKLYDEHLNTMANLYSNSDLIGIPVDKVD